MAQQDAIRQNYIVKRQDLETQALVIKSEADAEAAKLISDAIQKNGAGVVAMRKIEAAREIAASLSRNPNISFVHGGNTMNMLNLNKGM